MRGAAVLIMRRIVGVGDILPHPLFLVALVMTVGFVEFGGERLVQRGGNGGLDRGRDRHLGMVIVGSRLRGSIVRMTGIIVAVIVIMMIVMIRVGVRVVMRLVRVLVLVAVVIMVRGFGVSLAFMRMLVSDRRRSRLAFGVLDDLALHALATVAAA